jgi:hypothetical protein
MLSSKPPQSPPPLVKIIFMLTRNGSISIPNFFPPGLQHFIVGLSYLITRSPVFSNVVVGGHTTNIHQRFPISPCPRTQGEVGGPPRLWPPNALITDFHMGSGSSGFSVFEPNVGSNWIWIDSGQRTSQLGYFRVCESCTPPFYA